LLGRAQDRLRPGDAARLPGPPPARGAAPTCLSGAADPIPCLASPRGGATMVDERLAGAPPESAVPAHAVEEYLPEPKGRRAGVALCLSGGGLRAELFH